MTIDAAPVSLKAAVASIPGILEGRSPQIEREQTIPEDVINALRDSGALRALLPRELGGLGTSSVDFFDAIETLAVVDASTAWVTFITNGTKFLACGRIADAGLERILARGPDTIVAGVTAPRGRAERSSGGFRLSGRWAYASGCLHADWILAGATITANGEPETEASGLPRTKWFILPVSDVKVLDTWDPIGLRGTGSHDFEIDGVFVPESMAVGMTDPVRESFPAVGINRGAAAATSVGIGRGVLENFKSNSQRARAGLTGGTPLRDQDVVTYRFAEAQGLVDSGRAFLRNVMSQLEERLAAGERPSNPALPELDLAMQVAIFNSLRAVDLLCEVAGGPSIQRGQPMERMFRDAHAAANNAANSPVRLATIGKALLSQTP